MSAVLLWFILIKVIVIAMPKALMCFSFNNLKYQILPYFGRRASYAVLKLRGIKGYKHHKTTVNPSLQHASTNDNNKLEEWSP